MPNAASRPEGPLATATRIAAGDDRSRYDAVAMTLHWATVALVLAQFALAETWDAFGRPTRHLMIATHMSFGILLGTVVLVRIIWRLIPGHQTPPIVSGAVELASKTVHYLLYLMLVAEAVLGFALRWSGGEAMSFFGLQIPPMIPRVSHAANDLIGEIHEWNGWAIVILASGHAAAALYHHLVLRDRVLVRMLPLARPRS